MGIYPVRFLFVLFMLASGPSLAGAPSGLSDLPLREFPSMGGEKILLVYFTGDGGWNNFSQQLVRQINANHCPVVAFDCRKYFWEAKDPVKFAEDVQRLISHYLALWKLEKVALVGYSFGADVVAFLPAQLQHSFVDKLLPITLMSPSHSTDFEVRLSDLIGSTKGERKYNVQEALLKSHVPVLCVFGQEEDLYLKENLGGNKKIRIKHIPGSHRYDNDTALLTGLIMENIARLD